IKSVVDYGVGNRIIESCSLPKFSQLFPEKIIMESRKSLELTELRAFFNSLKSLKKHYIANILLIILTACRANEVLLRKPHEKLDQLDNGVIWYIPAERMKKSREHSVYVYQEAIKLLDWKTCLLYTLWTNLKRINFKATMHGFRALFFSTMIERLPQYKDAISVCIAHGKDLTNESDKSYHRYDYEKEKVIIFTAWYEILKEHGIQELIDML
ncbi:site-specific integrase, partial [Psittacicella hinzii]|uniref:hypothetical protein n=1 Tax=Psittacicella hinzii TaxID=2028575 RepID=UPI00360DB470